MKLQQAQYNDMHNEQQMLAPKVTYVGQVEQPLEYYQMEPTQLELFQQQLSRSHHYHSPKQTSYCTIFIVYFTIFLIWYMLSLFMQERSIDSRNYVAVGYFVDVLAIMITVTYTVLIKASNHIYKNKKLPLNLAMKWQKSFVTNIPKANCKLCTYYKFPRMSHCNTCGSCIYKLDHHCTFTQNCVSFKNQKVFLQFLWYLSIGNIMFWFYSIAKIWDLLSQGELFSHYSLKLYLIWVVALFLSIFLGSMIVVLTVFHTLIICTNFSTLQMMKKKATCQLPFIEWRELQLSDEFASLFNRGIIQNFKAVFSKNIVKCFLPTIREPQNQYLCQAMAPEPTKRQLVEFSEQIHSDRDRDEKLRKAIGYIKKLYVGKKFKIHDNEITL